jgi:hypothetical protein
MVSLMAQADPQKMRAEAELMSSDSIEIAPGDSRLEPVRRMAPPPFVVDSLCAQALWFARATAVPGAPAGELYPSTLLADGPVGGNLTVAHESYRFSRHPALKPCPWTV